MASTATYLHPMNRARQKALRSRRQLSIIDARRSPHAVRL